MTSFHSHSSLSVLSVCSLQSTVMVFSSADVRGACTYIIRAPLALHPLTGIAHCLQSNQTDAHFFWKEDISETEPLSNALKLHFHLLLWSVFLLFRRKLFWILFRGRVSSEWAFTFLFSSPMISLTTLPGIHRLQVEKFLTQSCLFSV